MLEENSMLKYMPVFICANGGMVRIVKTDIKNSVSYYIEQ